MTDSARTAIATMTPETVRLIRLVGATDTFSMGRRGVAIAVAERQVTPQTVEDASKHLCYRNTTTQSLTLTGWGSEIYLALMQMDAEQ